MGLFEGQEVRLGNHRLVVKSRRAGRIYAHCVETCCSEPATRIAVKMPEDMFCKFIDHINYTDAMSDMTETINNITSTFREQGPLQEQADDGSDPSESWEKRSLVMEG